MVVPRGLEAVLSIDPEVMHGVVCFAGTRVPLTVFLDNLDEGMGAVEFVEEYPTVSLEQALAVLAWQHEHTRNELGLNLAS